HAWRRGVGALGGDEPVPIAPSAIPWVGILREPMIEITYTVRDMSCGHCEQAVSSELAAVAGVESVDVDLDTKPVTLRGEPPDDSALRAAIEDAGYQAA